MHARPLAAALVLAVCLGLACRTARSPAGSTPGVDASIVDRTVDPCVDFYAFACGGWLAHTTIPADRPIWSRSFTEINERNLAILRDIAQAQADGQLDPADRYPKKTGDFYASCMDEAGIEARGTADLAAAWKKIDEVKNPATLAPALARLHASGIFPVFQIGSDQDARDATQVIGVVAQGGLSLPDRDYYTKTDPKTVAIQKAYRDHVATMFRLAGASSGEATRQAAVVYGLEKALAEKQWTRVELRDPKRVYNRVELAGLERLAPRFPWKGYLEALGRGGLTTFSTTTPGYLARVNELLARTPAATWRAYLKWRILAVTAAQRALPRRFFDESFAFQSRTFTGTKEPELRWKHCVRATDGALGEALGQAYVRRTFGEDGKTRTKELVSAIEAAFGRDLDGVSWMDDATRQRAHAKVEKVANKVGYPDVWRSYDALEVDRASFFKSLLAANAFEVARDLSKIGKPVDRNEWQMSPPTVNAYYNPAMNEMVFPAGILQPPFFQLGAPDAVNYGAIGMVVGHELTHGFDDEGRQFDASGNLSDWWTPAVSGEFDRRAECVARQYADYVAIDDVKLNGKLTLGENIADMGGIKLALAAYQATHKGAQAAIAGFTPEQALFLGYAQSWCALVRPEYARLRAQTDPHSPPRWRVNGPLSDLEAFSKAFACKPGSPMARAGEARCEVW